MSEFFHMGGYAAYVWSAYGLSVLVLVLNVIAARKRNLTVKKEYNEEAQEKPPIDGYVLGGWYRHCRCFYAECV